MKGMEDTGGKCRGKGLRPVFKNGKGNVFIILQREGF